MFLWELEKEIEHDIRNHAFDKWFGCAKERHPVLQNYPCVDDLLREFKDRDIQYTERHNSILDALITELQSCPHNATGKLLIYVFIPLLVKCSEERKSADRQPLEDIHGTVIYFFLEILSDFPLKRLGNRIFGNIKHRLENLLVKEWIGEDRSGTIEYLDEFTPGLDTTQQDDAPLEAFIDRESAKWLLNELRCGEFINADDLEIITKFDIHGVSLRAMAREKMVPVDYLKKRRQRALAAIRERFKKYF